MEPSDSSRDTPPRDGDEEERVCRALESKIDLLEELERHWLEARLTLERDDPPAASIQAADRIIERIEALDRELGTALGHESPTERIRTLEDRLKASLQTLRESHRLLSEKARETLRRSGHELARVRENRAALSNYRQQAPRRRSSQNWRA